MDKITDIAEKVGGLTGRMDSLVELVAEHNHDRKIDHAAVLAAVHAVSLKLDGKADKSKLDDMQDDHNTNTLFRKAAVWIIMIGGAAFITNIMGGFTVIAKAAGL